MARLPPAETGSVAAGARAGGSASPLRPGRETLLWLSALALALAFVWLDASVRLTSIRRVTERDPSGLPPVPVAAGSPTGYAGNQHRLVLPGLGMDGYHWILQTERMLAGEGLRIRAIPYDNSPEGREVHWAGFLRWWGGGVAAAYRLFHPGLSLPLALERVAPWANTLLLTLLLVVLTPLVAWRFGAVSAALFAAGAVSVYPFYEYFVVGYFDHHGMATMTSLLAVLFLGAGGAGWVRTGPEASGHQGGVDPAPGRWLPDPSGARRWFLASAAAAGVSLWISAATIVPVLAGAGAGALVATAWLGRTLRTSGPWRVEPTLWRTWGVAGAALSLFFYLLEYFPGHLGMRLEVNHPLYALAWLGAGDFLCRAAGGSRPSPPSSRAAWIVLDLAALLLLPAVVLLARDGTFRVADPFLWSLHADQILEFLSLGRHVARMSPTETLAGVSVLPLLALPLAALLWPTPLTGRSRWAWRGWLTLMVATGVAFAHTMMLGLLGSVAAALAGDAVVLGVFFLLLLQRGAPPLAPPLQALLSLGALSALPLLGLSLMQVRWLGIASALWLATLVLAATAFGTAAAGLGWTPLRRGVAAALLGLVLIPFPLFTLRFAPQRRAQTAAPSDGDLQALVTREVSQWLRGRLGSEPGVVLTTPNATTWMVYFGGFQGLGTLYWENLDGLRATARIYGARTAEQALELLERHGVTHVVSTPWEPGLYLSSGPDTRALRTPPPGAFLARHLEGSDATRLEDLPAWLVPLPFTLPSAALLEGSAIRVFEVVPEQPPETARVRVAEYLQAVGRSEEAEQELRASVDIRPNLPALALLARLHYLKGDLEALTGTLQRLRENLGDAEELDLGDRVNLAVAFALARDVEVAAAQLARALDGADERGLRRLSPDQLAILIGLARQLGVAAGRDDVLDLALGLLPPAAREGLAPPDSR